MRRPMDRLRRSSNDRMLVGVCSGLAEYFAVDPVLVRIGFVALAIAGGSGVLLYVALAIIMPTDEAAGSASSRVPSSTEEETAASPDSNGAAGETINAAESAAEPLVDESDALRRRRTTAAAVLIVIGAIWLMSSLGVFFWSRWDFFWPFALIAIGGALLLASRSRRA